MTISKANDFRTRISCFKTFSELYDRNQGNGLYIQNNQIEKFQDYCIDILKTVKFILFS